MSDYYRQPIAVFGLIIPVVVSVIMAGSVLYYTGSVKKEYAAKQKEYDLSQQAKRKIKMLRGQVNENRESLDAWDDLLKTETRGTFLQHWKDASEDFNGKELTKTSRSWINFSEGIGKGVSQPSSQVVMSFVGTYRAMQQALMNLETQLPTMQLDSLDMSPEDNGKGVKFTTTYTVWTLR